MKIFEPPRASSIMIEQRETSLFLERKKKEDRSFSSPRENTYSVSSWTNLIPSEGVHQLFTVRKRYAILKLRSDFRRGISQTRFTMVATEGNTIPCKNAERGRGGERGRAISSRHNSMVSPSCRKFSRSNWVYFGKAN